MRVHAPRAGVSLQAAVDRAHGHGLWLPTMSSQAVTGSSLTLGATAVTAGTAHTKGAWVEVTSATTAETTGLIVFPTAVNRANGADTATLLDIGIGGAGSEVVIVPNMQVGWTTINIVWQVPVCIPRGSRIAIRAQSTRTSQNVAIGMILLQDKVTQVAPAKALVNIGANTATSAGVTLTTPGSNNTKGAWTELTASCPQALHAVTVCAGLPSGTTIAGATSQLIDVAVGAAGSEVEVISNVHTRTTNSEDIQVISPTLHPVNVPAGARISARFQTTNTSNGLVDLALLGVPA